MENFFSSYRQDINGLLLAPEAFRLFCDLKGTAVPCEAYTPALISLAESKAQADFPLLPMSLYRQYDTIGNRKNFENLYFARRRIAEALLMGEFCEGKGRFTEKLADALWAIMEETTWVLPAHINHIGAEGKSAALKGLPLSYDGRVRYIDLFAGDTAGLIAWALYLMGDAMREDYPVVVDRMRFELQRRIIQPFLTDDTYWWMGTKGNTLNNWTPWIVSNILTVCALTESDPVQRAAVVGKCLEILERFIRKYPEDGGCDEGPGYWNVAGASFFDCCELLYDLTGGRLNVFDQPLLRKMGEYIANVNICREYNLNFADADARVRPNAQLIMRFGRRCGSEMLYTYGAYVAGWSQVQPTFSCGQGYRTFKSICENNPPAQKPYQAPAHVWMPNLEVMAARELSDNGECRADKGLYLAMKGGHNAESHNHNDVGNVLVYCDGEPFLIDVGVGTYTADTFNQNRYKSWSFQSSYHNLPDFDGIMQPPGGRFHAEDVQYSEGCLRMELKSAYPPEAGILHYIREAALSGHAITVCDTVELSEPRTVCFNWMLRDAPDAIDNACGKIDFANGLTCAFDHAHLQAELEELPLTDPRFRSAWKREVLYRLKLRSKEPTENGAFTLRIQHTKG